MQSKKGSQLFTQQGQNWYDFWLVNGNADFALIPPNVIQGLNNSAPIPVRLQNGKNQTFGEKHILFKHANWVKHIANSVPELIYMKPGQNGTIYTTEQHSKIKILLPLSPCCLMVLEYLARQEEFLSVTTIYDPRNSTLDGEIIGKYLSSYRL